MRTMIFVLAFISITLTLWAAETTTKLEKTPISIYGGLALGSKSQTDVGGQDDRDSHFGLGIDTMAFRKYLGVGLNYNYFDEGKEGNNVVNVARTSHWMQIDGAYRFSYRESFVPYVFVGLGSMHRKVETKVFERSETSGDFNWTQSLGLGCFVNPKSAPVGFNFALRYYQYENENGMLATLSVGYTTPTKLAF